MYALRCGRGRRRCFPHAPVSWCSHCALRAAVCPGVFGRAVRPLAARSPSPCRRELECAGLALHGSCGREVQRKRCAVHRPFKARRAVRPSAASGRPVRLGTVRVPSRLEPRPLPRQGSAGRQSSVALVRAVRLAVQAGLATIGKCAQHTPPPGRGLTRLQGLPL